MIESVEVNRKQLMDAVNAVKAVGKNGKIIQVRALNRTVNSTKSNTAKQISKTVNLAQKRIKEEITVGKATQGKPLSKMTISGKPIPLIEYKARQLLKGVSFKVDKAQGTERYRHAFIATMLGREGGSSAGALTGNNHAGVFERNRDSPNYDGRLPIKEKFGPAIPNVFEFTPGMSQAVLLEAQQKLVNEINSQLNYLLQKELANG